MKKVIPYVLSTLIGMMSVGSYVLGFYLVFAQVSLGPVFLILAPVIVITYILLVMFVPLIKKQSSKLVFHFRMSLLCLPLGIALIFITGNIIDAFS